MLLREVERKGLAERYKPANASGNPTQPRDPKRYDTLASSSAMLTEAIDLVQNHANTLDPIFCTATPKDHPTNNLYCPSGVAQLGNDRPAIRMYAKTGTDRAPNEDGSPGGQLHSMIVVIKDERNPDDPKTYAIYHFHSRSENRQPIRTMAAIVRQIVLDKTDIRDPALLGLLEKDASGIIKPDDVKTGRAQPPKALLASSRNEPKSHAGHPLRHHTGAMATAIISPSLR